MKYLITYSLLFFSLIVISQNENNSKLNEIRACYSTGLDIKRQIEQGNFSQLKKLKLKESSRLDSLISIEQDKTKEYEFHTDMYFNPDLNAYAFTIYNSKWIKTGSNWGLSEYLYVIELLIDFKETAKKPHIKSVKIILEELEIKKWWLSLMKTYKESKFLRKKWADKYGLIPPPPPPPEDEEWLNN